MYVCIYNVYNAIKYYIYNYIYKILHNTTIYVLSKNKVKLGGLEVPFKNNSFGKKNNY